MFSKACEYGIRSAIYIARQSLDGNKASIKTVAKAIDSPEAYTSKILQQLKKNDIIHAEKGPGGGFSMDRRTMESTSLKQLVYAFDGDQIYKACGLGLKECNAEKPCPLHEQFAGIRNELTRVLDSTSIGSLATQLQDGISFLKA
jgi:Rrf2 family protein